MSLYSEYLKEREGKEILECPSGFATYRILGNECYLVDIYVKPEFRKEHVARAMADQVAELAKGAGCKWLTGSVSPNANGAHTSLLVLIAYGMKLLRSDKDIIFLGKEL